MKQIILGTALSVATVFTALPAFAHDGHSARHEVHARHAERGAAASARDGDALLRRMKADLGLSHRQVMQIRRILDDSEAAHRRVGRGAGTEHRHRAIRERTEQRIAAVLRPDQRHRAERLRHEDRAGSDMDRFDHRRAEDRHGRGRGHGAVKEPVRPGTGR